MYRICSPCTPGCHKRMHRAFNGGYYFPLFTCPFFWKEKEALYERNHRTMNNEEKILGILMQMQSDIADLKAGQAKMQEDIADIKTNVQFIWDDLGHAEDRLDAHDAAFKKIM